VAFGVLGDVTWSIKKKIIKDQQKPSNHPNKTGSLLVYSTCQACDSKKKPSKNRSLLGGIWMRRARQVSNP